MTILQHPNKKIKQKISKKKIGEKIPSLLFLHYWVKKIKHKLFRRGKKTSFLSFFRCLSKKIKHKSFGRKKIKNLSILSFFHYAFLSPAFVAIIFFPKFIHPSDIVLEKSIDRIGLIADIHAASQDTRESDNSDNVVSPAIYKKIFPEVLEKMEKDKVDLTISLGDQTNNSSPKHAIELKRMTEEEEMPMLWVKGNHDTNRERIMSVLGTPSDYYFIDRKDWRIIVLDSSEQPGDVFYQGGMSQEQIEWLRGALDVKKDILIAIHHPIFDKETRETVYPIYQEFENIISGNKWVRYVVSGHWHTPYWEKEYNDIEYIGIPSLLLKGEEGFYKVLELPSYLYPAYDGPE